MILSNASLYCSLRPYWVKNSMILGSQILGGGKDEEGPEGVIGTTASLASFRMRVMVEVDGSPEPLFTSAGIAFEFVPSYMLEEGMISSPLICLILFSYSRPE